MFGFSWPCDTRVVWHSPRALCNKSFWLGMLPFNMKHNQRGSVCWKSDLIYPNIFSLCVIVAAAKRQTNTNWKCKKGFFTSNFLSLSIFVFQCNNQRNIKAGSEYPTPTKFALQRHTKNSSKIVLSPSCRFYHSLPSSFWYLFWTNNKKCVILYHLTNIVL